MKFRYSKITPGTGPEKIKSLCYGLIAFEILLGAAHLAWPEYQWGQSRKSWFNLSNTLTLASWFGSMQLICIALLLLVGAHRDEKERWYWFSGAMISLVLSFQEITSVFNKFKILENPVSDVYQRFVFTGLGFTFLFIFGFRLIHKVRRIPWACKTALTGLVFLAAFILIPESKTISLSLFRGMSKLMGETLVLCALAAYLWQGAGSTEEEEEPGTGNAGLNLSAGVAGTAFAAIFLQIILFQTLIIFSNYNTAHSVISIALLGVSLGGITGYHLSLRRPLRVLSMASFLLPLSILFSFGAVVSFSRIPLAGSFFLMAPFAFAGFIITVALVISDSQKVYFFDLLGAGIAALLIDVSLTLFREENSLFFLIGFTFLNALFFIAHYPCQQFRRFLVFLSCGFALVFLCAGIINLKEDYLNLVLSKIEKKYPEAQIHYSKSSVQGRYDVVQRRPDFDRLEGYENGSIIDTIRTNPVKDYLIDPRLPYNLMENPSILIIGVSGDGITKTARHIGREVSGVEINPAIVDLMRNELKNLNGNNYKNIDVAVTNGRSFLERDDKTYDMITLMNAHFSRGSVYGRTASPEYLQTIESMDLYLRRLSDRGVLITEEPTSFPINEVSTWKILNTMRLALFRHGNPSPEKHFFIFKWKTASNNYIQILMKKSPFTREEVKSLEKWLDDVDKINQIEAMERRVKGPIKTAKTTILHTPFEFSTTNYSRIVRGDVDRGLLADRNMNVLTDDRPFPFDTDPSKAQINSIYKRTLLLSFLLAPFFLIPLFKNRFRQKIILPEMFIVIFTGAAYFLIEVLLIQRFAIFLGSPVITFCMVLGAMLVFSGLGSLWSRGIDQKYLWYSLLGINLFLAAHMWLAPTFFSFTANFPLLVKTLLSAVSIAPLAFVMGVPFPYILAKSKLNFNEKAPALLFALNGVFSAIAIPLALYTSTTWGLNAAFQIGMGFYILITILFLGIDRRRTQLLVNVLAAIVVLLIIAAPWAGSWGSKKTPGGEGLYDVYAVGYGRSLFREDKIIKGGSPEKKQPFEWYFWVVSGRDRVFMVDTGFYNVKKAKKKGFSIYAAPIKRLAKLGISPNEVTDIILTHAHWDHAGGLKPFPKANIWMQQKEYDFIKPILDDLKSRPEESANHYLSCLSKAGEEGRLMLVDGKANPAPGITLFPGGAHTVGSQYVKARTADGWVVLAGDAAYQYHNIHRHVPIGAAMDHNENLKTIQKMIRMAASPFFIIPGHDPGVLELYPTVAPGIVRISSLEE